LDWRAGEEAWQVRGSPWRLKRWNKWETGNTSLYLSISVRF
jgi:hypothetical protein